MNEIRSNSSGSTDSSQPPDPLKKHRSMAERIFEWSIWNARFLALVPVVFALLVAIAVTIFATADVIRLVVYAFDLTAAEDPQLSSGRLLLVAKVVKIVDLYLVSTFMIIFSLGLYELFISRIDPAERSELAGRLLRIHDLDDLKDRLTKILLLILAMLYLEFALRLQPSTGLELLYLGFGTMLIALALFLTQKGKGLKTAHPPESKSP